MLSAIEIRDAIARGELSAAECLKSVWARVDALDGELGAFLTVDRAGAEAAAAEIDAAKRRGEPLGPLAGVPLAVKDNICTRGLRTTAASKILDNFVPPYDATAVARLRAAGAVIVGKTNMDEFGMGSSSENSGYFPTKNPWDTKRVPGGSSGGSAAAVAAGIVPLALGSDTGGSIRQPAALCGLTGFKPSYGRVSRYGLIAFGSSLDQIGPLARNVKDCALALEIMSGRDPKDATSLGEAMELPRWTESLEGVRLGYPREFREVRVEPAVHRAIDEALELFEKLGATVVDIRLPTLPLSLAVYQILANAEASSNLARYDGVHYGHRSREAADVPSLMAKSRAEGFGTEVKRRICLGNFVLSSGYIDAYYRKAQAVRRKISADFERVFGQVDAIVGPTSPIPAFSIGERISDPLLMYAVDVFTLAANLAGVPAVSLPCGLTRDGLPLGLQLMGRRGEDSRLLEIAHGFQESTRFHRALSPMASEEPR